MDTAEQAAIRRLPPGSHGIPADVVARNQRERLVAAMAEVCAERGYAEVTVAGVAKRAGVSSVTFYRQFADKLDCMLAAHRQLLGRLLEEVDRAREAAGGEARPRAAIHTALALFAADPPSARLLTVEILAAGPEGAKRYDAAVEAFARRLWPDGDRGDATPLPVADWARVAGMLALVGKLAIAADLDCLSQLEEEFMTMVT